jgi:hypothetical protein
MNEKINKHHTYDKQYLAGMTVTERLFETGMLDKFEIACIDRNYKIVREILRLVFVDELSIAMKIDNLVSQSDDEIAQSQSKPL